MVATNWRRSFNSLVKEFRVARGEIRSEFCCVGREEKRYNEETERIIQECKVQQKPPRSTKHA